MLSAIICIKKKNKIDNVTFISLNIGMILYIIMTSYLYFMNFSKGEVEILSCCSRYLSTYFIAIFLFVFYSVLCTFNFKHWYFFCAFALLTHPVIDYTFVSRFYPALNEAEKNVYTSITEQRERIEEIKKYAEDNDRLYVFNGQNEYFGYALTPVWVLPEWGTNQNDMELFLEDNVYIQADYVYFADDTDGTIESDEFCKKWGCLFENQDEICDGGLYKVIYSGNEWKLRLMEEI